MHNRQWVFTLLVAILLISAFATAQAPLVISEFRVRGPNGANDEFIEIHNASDTNHTVAPGDNSIGYSIVASDGIRRCLIPTGTVIPARGFFLCVNSVGYSLSSYPSGNGTTATGDATYTMDIPDNAGIALFDTALPVNFGPATRLDAVGSTSEANTLYKEGPGYSALTPFSIDYSFARTWSGTALPSAPVAAFNACTVPATASIALDTGNNATDLKFLDTNGTSAGAGQLLGVPGPQNLSSPPSSLPASLSIEPIDGSVSAGASPNLVRDFTSEPANNSTFGTISFRRRITNNTGVSITRLRFRFLEHSTFPAPSGFADLRGRTSSSAVVTLTAGGTTTVQSLTLEQPPSQPNGSGHNSSVSADTITLGTPLAPGASVDVNFLFGIQQIGRFRIGVLAEALPQGNGLWQVIGTTDNADSNYPFKDCNVSVSTSVVLATSAASVTYGADVTLTATVSSSPVATGAVEFFQGGVSIGTATLDGAGVATKTVSGLNVASYNFTATYPGAGQFLASSSGTEPVTVTKKSLTATADSLSRPYGAQNPPLTISYSGFENGDDVNALDVQPTASMAADSTSPVNSYPITVSGGSDNNYSFSYVPGTLTITKASSNIALTATASVILGSPVALTATVTVTPSVVPTGTVTFKDGTATLGTGTLDGTGKATFSTSTLAAGTHSVTAEYGGDTRYVNSTSAANSVTVQDFTFPTTAPAITVIAGQPQSANLAITPMHGLVGTVSFTCSVPANMAQASCSASSVTMNGTTAVNSTLTVTTAGPHRIAAATNNHNPWHAATFGYGLAAFFLVGVPLRNRRRRLLFGCLVLIALIGGLVGCGGNKSRTDPGTAAGSYVLTVTGSSSTATHTLSVPVTVQ